jgi:hypothetical protein
MAAAGASATTTVTGGPSTDDGQQVIELTKAQKKRARRASRQLLTGKKAAPGTTPAAGGTVKAATPAVRTQPVKPANGNKTAHGSREEAGGESGGEESPDSDEVLGKYVVDRILDAEVRDGEEVYLVAWRNHPESSNSWEPFCNLSEAQGALQAFDERVRRAKAGSGGLAIDEDVDWTPGTPARSPKPARSHGGMGVVARSSKAPVVRVTGSGAISHFYKSISPVSSRPASPAERKRPDSSGASKQAGYNTPTPETRTKQARKQATGTPERPAFSFAGGSQRSPRKKKARAATTTMSDGAASTEDDEQAADTAAGKGLNTASAAGNSADPAGVRTLVHTPRPRGKAGDEARSQAAVTKLPGGMTGPSVGPLTMGAAHPAGR